MSSLQSSSQYDKSLWGQGPWLSEPDRLQWIDSATGLSCLIVRQSTSGHLCGYVAVPPGHPAHGTDYSGMYDCTEVHGGLTYSNSCEGTVCHVPEPGQPDNVWWFGFDCAHGEDFSPGSEAFFAKRGLHFDNSHKTYRTVEYVKAECSNLAQQLAALQCASSPVHQCEEKVSL
jgi:hypothetical protein